MGDKGRTLGVARVALWGDEGSALGVARVAPWGVRIAPRGMRGRAMEGEGRAAVLCTMHGNSVGNRLLQK